jgi:Protein of unknown function (DUF1493)
MQMNNASADLSTDLRDCLAWLGISSEKIQACNRATRVWQDLGVYGEIADDFLEELSKCHQIDLSQFDPTRYYPTEFAGNGLFSRIFIPFIPFLDNYLRKRRVFAPLTLGMIDDAIVSKHLA